MIPAQVAAIREAAQRQVDDGRVACYVTSSQVLGLALSYEAMYRRLERAKRELAEAQRRLGEIHVIACGAVFHHLDHALPEMRADIDAICDLANMGKLPIDNVGGV